MGILKFIPPCCRSKTRSHSRTYSVFWCKKWGTSQKSWCLFIPLSAFMIWSIYHDLPTCIIEINENLGKHIIHWMFWDPFWGAPFRSTGGSTLVPSLGLTASRCLTAALASGGLALELFVAWRISAGSKGPGCLGDINKLWITMVYREYMIYTYIHIYI